MEVATLPRPATKDRPPERSHQQRLAALGEANRIRTHRADLKRELRAGRVSPRAVLADPDCGSMQAFELLLALPKVGRVKANRVLTRCRISPSKTLGGMTDRQRSELVAALP